VVTGVSGSGKSTLISKVLYPAMAHLQGVGTGESGKFDKLEGAYTKVKQVEFIDQNPIGKSSRSNPVSYVKALDAIRNLMASQALAKNRGYSPAHFSFNVEGGRCETCQGEGEIKIEMQFMADIFLKCESCHGRRFKDEVLEVTFKEKNIAEILDLTVDDAIKFFGVQPKIAERLQPLADVGLGYVRLGQSSNTLSGGEAQRVKLAFFLSKANPIDSGMLFIFDEPTTGLHFHDISKLLKSIQALVNRGNTVIVIEHNLEMIKCADWIVDLGPEGGEAGGNLVFEGPVDDILNVKESITARYLKEKLQHA
jgi:excinuclease ABC subunit A